MRLSLIGFGVVIGLLGCSRAASGRTKDAAGSMAATNEGVQSRAGISAAPSGDGQAGAPLQSAAAGMAARAHQAGMGASGAILAGPGAGAAGLQQAPGAGRSINPGGGAGAAGSQPAPEAPQNPQTAQDVGPPPAPESKAPPLVVVHTVAPVDPPERTIGWREEPALPGCPDADSFACNGQCISLSTDRLGEWQGSCRTLASDVSVKGVAADAAAAYYIDWRARELRRVDLQASESTVITTFEGWSADWLQLQAAELFFFADGCGTNQMSCLWSAPTAGGAPSVRAANVRWRTPPDAAPMQIENAAVYHIAYDTLEQGSTTFYFNESLGRTGVDSSDTQPLARIDEIASFVVHEEWAWLATRDVPEKFFLIATDGSGMGSQFSASPGVGIREALFLDNSLYLNRFDNGSVAEYGYRYVERYDLDRRELTALFTIPFDADLLRASARGLLFGAALASAGEAFGRAPLEGGELVPVAQVGPHRKLDTLTDDALYVTVDRADNRGAVVEVRLSDGAAMR